MLFLYKIRKEKISITEFVFLCALSFLYTNQSYSCLFFAQDNKLCFYGQPHHHRIHFSSAPSVIITCRFPHQGCICLGRNIQVVFLINWLFLSVFKKGFSYIDAHRHKTVILYTVNKIITMVQLEVSLNHLDMCCSPKTY